MTKITQKAHHFAQTTTLNALAVYFILRKDFRIMFIFLQYKSRYTKANYLHHVTIKLVHTIIYTPFF